MIPELGPHSSLGSSGRLGTVLGIQPAGPETDGNQRIGGLVDSVVAKFMDHCVGVLEKKLQQFRPKLR
jgi:hypothetical protein